MRKIIYQVGTKYYSDTGERLPSSRVQAMRSLSKESSRFSFLYENSNAWSMLQSKNLMGDAIFIMKMDLELPDRITECDLQRVKMQIGGTCWFNSIVNGWLLSSRGRVLFKTQLDEFKKTQMWQPYERVQACPMMGRLPLNYFWHYVDSKLNNTNSSNNNFNNALLIRNLGLRNISNEQTWMQNVARVLTNMVPRDVNALRVAGITNLNKLREANIDSLPLTPIGKRKLKATVESYTSYNQYLRKQTYGGWPTKDSIVVYEKIFGPRNYRWASFTPSELSSLQNPGKLKIVQLTYSYMTDIERTIEIGSSNFILSHAYIIIMGPAGGHAICGYMCGSVPYLYDSGQDKNVKMDWRKLSNVHKYTKQGYPDMDVKPEECVYVYIKA